ncbi:hypothetical protein LCGC14_1790030 [marine sediment metagenome]|uniref:Uncharacterized protein n=1 Tax=marine sediment metagenome TaxID=412755 RepID=A0A0F9GSX4_9ZZZZ
MKEFNTFAVGTDGWYEGEATPIEPPDTAAFGWLNFESGDEIVPPTAAATGNSPQPMWLLNVVNK